MSDLPTLDALVQVHDLGPNDILIVRTTRPLTVEDADRIRTRLAQIVPDNQCIVLPADLSIEVVRPEVDA